MLYRLLLGKKFSLFILVNTRMIRNKKLNAYRHRQLAYIFVYIRNDDESALGYDYNTRRLLFKNALYTNKLA